jgi:hypothetical protein
MSFTLSEVEVSDAESIARHVDVPANQNGPLYQTMFPLSNKITATQEEEIIRWYIEMLEDAFQERWESHLKACTVDGTPIGFCGWTIIERDRENQVDASDGQANEQPREAKRKASWEPETLDIDSWIAVSKALRTERERVLKDLDNICRKLIHVIALQQPSNGCYI